MTDPEFGPAEERQLRHLLAAEPSPTMPPDVYDQIQATISAQGVLEGVSAAEPLRKRGKYLASLVAAAAFVVIAGAVVVPLSRSAGQPDVPVAAAPCAAAAEVRSDPMSIMSTSNAQYSAAEFPEQVAALLSRTADCSSPTAATTVSEPAGLADLEDSSTAQDLQTARTESTVITECLWSVIPGETLVAVDRGRFGDREVVVAVIARPRHAMAIDCSEDPARVLHEAGM